MKRINIYVLKNKRIVVSFCFVFLLSVLIVSYYGFSSYRLKRQRQEFLEQYKIEMFAGLDKTAEMLVQALIEDKVIDSSDRNAINEKYMEIRPAVYGDAIKNLECEYKYAEKFFNSSDWEYYLADKKESLLSWQRINKVSNYKEFSDKLGSISHNSMNKIRNLALFDKAASSFLVKFERMNLFCK